MSCFSLIASRVGNGLLMAAGIIAMGLPGSAWAAGSDETVPPHAKPLAQEASPNFVLPEPTPGETLIYFFTSDSDATGTVITLLNTDSIDHVVPLRGFSHDGQLVYSLNIPVPASSMRRLVSDAIAAGAPPSWTGANGGPPPITTNFTDFTYFATLSLPKGVRVDGYTVFNPGTGTIDPRADQGAVPLRFMYNGKPAVVPIFM